MRHEFVPYAIRFREPVLTAAGRWEIRRGAWLVLHGEDGRTGLGEVAPLPGVESDAALAAALERPDYRAAAFGLAELDLEGQRAGCPVARLLGESPRASVAVNALCLASGASEAAEEAAAAVADGFGTLKLKVGALAAARDIERVAAIRARVGAAPRLRLDANGAWDEATALAVLRAVERHGIEYVEDPVAWDPGALRGRTGIAVARDAASAEAAWRAVRERSADFLVLKPMQLGGVRAAREIARAALDAGIGVVVTSSFDTAVGVAGALHLAASLPGPERAHGLATAELLGDAPLEGLGPPREGRMRLPGEPGLGVRRKERGA